MHPDWKTFLQAAGGVIAEGRVLHFGAPEREVQAVDNANLLTDLSHLGLIAVSGPDAQTFLHSQFTHDVRAVSDAHSQLNAYCSPKGRVLAVFRLFKRADVYYLALPHELVDAVLKRLRLFVLRTQVQLSDASAALAHIGLAGPTAEDSLRTLMGSLPAHVNDSTHIPYAGGTLTILRVPGPTARFEIIGDVAPVKTLWQALAAHAMPVGAAPWALLDIQSGIPTIHSATADVFVPQMINLELIDALSFTKGCYPGQEIVARTQYLGTLKRRMVRAQVESDGVPQPGTALYTAHSEQRVGEVVDAQPAPHGGYQLLAVVQIASAAADEVRLQSQQGPVLRFMELPYNAARGENA